VRELCERLLVDPFNQAGGALPLPSAGFPVRTHRENV
jgi:hypothetical protein